MNTYELAYVFPGQGSQRIGMGADLFDRYPEIEAEASDVLGYSIRELCLTDPRQELSQTRFTQPALYTVNTMTYRSAVADSGRAGDVLAGHSLGEYNALEAAGVFDFATGLRLVQQRGAIMSRVTGSGMAAVIGLSSTDVVELLQRHGFDGIDVANQNSPVQIAIAGLAADIKEAARVFNEIAGCRYVQLRVSGAFHSRYMAAARDEFEAFLHQFTFAPPARPVLSNMDARPHEAGRIPERLARQITHPVKWCESVQVMLGAGVDEFHEAGPGNVLTKLIDAIRRQAPPIAIDWPM